MKCPKCGKEVTITSKRDRMLDEIWTFFDCICGWHDEKEVG